MADQAPQATLNGVGKLQKNGSTVWYVAEVKGPTLRNSGSGIPDPEFRSKLILPWNDLIPTCVPWNLKKYTEISFSMYEKNQGTMEGLRSKAFLTHDLFVNVIIFSSRAQFFLGKLKSSKRLLFEADNAQQKRQHLPTTFLCHLFNMYVMLLRQDHELILHSTEKLKQIEPLISESQSFQLKLRDLYKVHVLFLQSKDETEYEALYARIKKMTSTLENHIVYVSLFECAIKFLNWLCKEEDFKQFLIEIHSLTNIINNIIIPSGQEHVRSEIFRLYGDILSLKRSVMSDTSKIEFIYEKEKVVKYDLKTRKPISTVEICRKKRFLIQHKFVRF